MKRGVFRRRAAAVVSAVAMCVVLAVPPPQQTEAGWVDAEVASGTLAAITVPAPVATQQCKLSGGLTPKVTVYWKVPSGTSEFTAEDAELINPDGSLIGALTGLLLGNSVANTETLAGYTLEIRDGLLGGLLGSSKVIKLRLTKGGWTGPPLTITASAALLGFNPKCEVDPAP